MDQESTERLEELRDEMSIEITHHKDALEEKHGHRPDGGAPSEEGKHHLRDHRLHQEDKGRA